MRTTTFVRSSLLMLAALAGCSAEASGYATDLGADEDELRVSGSEIVDHWSIEGDWQVSEPLDFGEGAHSVALMWGLVSPELATPVEARVISGGVAGPWISATETWTEETLHTAIAVSTDLGEQVQVRVRVEDAASFEFLQYTGSPFADAPVLDDATAADDSLIQAQSDALRTDLRALGIVTREQWGARAARCSSSNTTKTRFAIHHTVQSSSNPQLQLRAAQQHHFNANDRCDIGYHFLIDQSGVIYEGRRLETLGAHTGGTNTGNIGISFIGCFDSSSDCNGLGSRTPSAASIEAAGRLVGTLSRLYGITVSTTTVKAHRTWMPNHTSCPGSFLFPRMADIIAIGRTRTLSSGSGGTTTPGGGGTTTPTTCTNGTCACAQADCWSPTLVMTSCGTRATTENFASGRYGIHRYLATFPANVATTIRLERTSGTFTPAVVLTDRSGTILYGAGRTPSTTINITERSNGRTGGVAEVTFTPTSSLSAYVMLTDWAVIDRGFSGDVSTSANYRVTATQSCR